MRRATFLIPCLVLLSFGASPAPAQLEIASPMAFVVPDYPPLARQAQIQGEVRVEVITDGKTVVSAHALSGHPMLADAAAKNAATWQFASDESTKFILIYHYSLRPPGTGLPEVHFRPPNTVAVEAARPELYAVFGKMGMGNWKLEARTPRGKSEMTLTPFRGPYSLRDSRESIDGKVVASDGSEFFIQYGRLDGSHVEFCVETVLPGSGSAMVLYKGETNGDTMAGTFSNATGTEGTWTAVKDQTTK